MGCDSEGPAAESAVLEAGGTGADGWASIGPLFDAYAPALHRYLTGRAGLPVADDLVSETFMVAFERWQHFDPSRGSARAWLFGIASNLLRHHRRAQDRHLAAAARAAGQADHPGLTDDRAVDRLDAAAWAARLAPKLAELDPVDLDILLLNAWAELTPTEIADALGVPAATVRTKLHRTRARLRAAIPLENPALLVALTGDSDADH